MGGLLFSAVQLRKRAPLVEDMDSEYLKQHVSKPLKFGLSEICQKKPDDPIKYLSEWLLKYVENVKHQQRLADEQAQLAKERQMADEEKQRVKAIQDEEASLANRTDSVENPL